MVALGGDGRVKWLERDLILGKRELELDSKECVKISRLLRMHGFCAQNV